MSGADFSSFDGDNDLEDVLESLEAQGYVPREPTVYEKLLLPHDEDTEVRMVLEKLVGGKVEMLHLVIEK